MTTKKSKQVQGREAVARWLFEREARQHARDAADPYGSRAAIAARLAKVNEYLGKKSRKGGVR